jgi:hypothetical protein
MCDPLTLFNDRAGAEVKWSHASHIGVCDLGHRRGLERCSPAKLNGANQSCCRCRDRGRDAPTHVLGG